MVSWRFLLVWLHLLGGEFWCMDQKPDNGPPAHGANNGTDLEEVLAETSSSSEPVEPPVRRPRLTPTARRAARQRLTPTARRAARQRAQDEESSPTQDCSYDETSEENATHPSTGGASSSSGLHAPEDWDTARARYKVLLRDGPYLSGPPGQQIWTRFPGGHLPSSGSPCYTCGSINKGPTYCMRYRARMSCHFPPPDGELVEADGNRQTMDAPGVGTASSSADHVAIPAMDDQIAEEDYVSPSYTSTDMLQDILNHGNASSSSSSSNSSNSSSGEGNTGGFVMSVDHFSSVFCNTCNLSRSYIRMIWRTLGVIYAFDSAGTDMYCRKIQVVSSSLLVTETFSAPLALCQVSNGLCYCCWPMKRTSGSVSHHESALKRFSAMQCDQLLTVYLDSDEVSGLSVLWDLRLPMRSRSPLLRRKPCHRSPRPRKKADCITDAAPADHPKSPRHIPACLWAQPRWMREGLQRPMPRTYEWVTTQGPDAPSHHCSQGETTRAPEDVSCAAENSSRVDNEPKTMNTVTKKKNAKQDLQGGKASESAGAMQQPVASSTQQVQQSDPQQLHASECASSSTLQPGDTAHPRVPRATPGQNVQRYHRFISSLRARYSSDGLQKYMCRWSGLCHTFLHSSALMTYERDRTEPPWYHLLGEILTSRMHWELHVVRVGIQCCHLNVSAGDTIYPFRYANFGAPHSSHRPFSL